MEVGEATHTSPYPTVVSVVKLKYSDTRYCVAKLWSTTKGPPDHMRLNHESDSEIRRSPIMNHKQALSQSIRI